MLLLGNCLIGDYNNSLRYRVSFPSLKMGNHDNQ